MYFFLGLLLILPMLLIYSMVPTPPGPGNKFGPGALIIFPFLYALAGLIFVPLGCWIYNMAAKLVGGLEVSVTDDGDA